MRIFTLAACSAATWLFVVACTSTSATGASTGSGSGGTDGDAGPSIIDTFCNAVAEPFCKADYTCCSSMNGTWGWGIGVDACRDEVATSRSAFFFCAPPGDMGRTPMEDALKTGITVFDKAQLDKCLALLNSMVGGGASCVEPAEHVLYTTCLNSFQGQIAPGDACPWAPTFIWPDRLLTCKDGSCDNGKCVPFLKTGDACVVDQPYYQKPNDTNCNYAKQEACWGVPGDGGAGGGDAGGAPAMGTCRPRGEIGDACDPGNNHECKSLYCDATGKCAVPDGAHSDGCDRF